MTDYETQCAWCHKPLNGTYVVGLPAFESNPETIRYCSAEHARARILELFGRDKHFGEKWVRYQVEIPPELAAILDEIHRKCLGVNASAATHANLTRVALRMYLETYLSVPEPATEGTATEMVDLPELESKVDNGEGLV